MGLKGSIIVFSKESNVRKKISGSFSSRDYNIKSVDSTSGLFLCLKEISPDILIIDSDVQLCAKIKSDVHYQYPVIFIAPPEKEFTKKQLLKAGADCYIRLPVSKKILIANVSSLLKKKEEKTEAINIKTKSAKDYKKIEKALIESEARLAGIINSAMDAVISVDSNQKVILFNPAAEAMFDCSSKEALGKSLDIFIPERFRAIHKKHIEDYGKTGITMRSMGDLSFIRGLRSNGEEFPIEASISQAEVGWQKIFTVIIRDITLKKKAEEELISSEARYRLLFKKNPLPMWVYDSSTLQFLAVNFAAVKTYGYSRDEFLSMTIENIRPPEDVPLLRKYIMERRTPYQHSGIWKHKKKDGTIIDVEIVSHEIEFDGKPARLVLSMDVTERVKAENELRKLSRAVEQSPASIIITNTDGIIEYVNPKFCKLTGYEFNEVIGKNPRILKSGETSELNYKKLWETIKAGEDWNGEFHNRKKNGDLFWEFASISPIKNFKGEITHFLAVKEDITERKKAEGEIKTSQEQLRALAAHLQNIREQERSAIAREIHDELGQVLTSLKMNLHFINKNIVPDENNINIHELKNEIKSMMSVIDNSVVRIRKIITELRPEVLDNLGLMAALEWQVKEFETKSGIQTKLKNLCGDIEIDKDVSIAVYRIFQEALTNIARHAKASEVDVKIEWFNNHLQMEIKDNGIGYDTYKISDKKTFGVLGMRERVIILGGDFKIEKMNPFGTKVSVSVPLEASLG
jgi:PAS domain S-box-containing protein